MRQYADSFEKLSVSFPFHEAIQKIFSAFICVKMNMNVLGLRTENYKKLLENPKVEKFSSARSGIIRNTKDYTVNLRKEFTDSCR